MINILLSFLFVVKSYSYAFYEQPLENLQSVVLVIVNSSGINLRYKTST